jgi:hypothetical protein
MIVEREEVRECKKERKRQGRWWEQGWNWSKSREER